MRLCCAGCEVYYGPVFVRVFCGQCLPYRGHSLVSAGECCARIELNGKICGAQAESEPSCVCEIAVLVAGNE